MKKLYNRKEDGVASTVGTIFALMIFTALLTIFMSQVVPVNMKENEAQHDLEVISQFSNMRSVIDLLTLTKNSNYTAYVPIKLGAPGIPLFASPTYGQLRVFPAGHNASYILSVHFLDEYGNRIMANASGSVQIFLPNRYYIPELISYENGALLRYNFPAKNSSFLVDPNIRFQKTGNDLYIYVTLQKIYGTSNSATGSDTRNLAISLVGESKNTYEVGNRSVNITVLSNYTYGQLNLNFTRAWVNYLESVLTASGLTNTTTTTYYLITGTANNTLEINPSKTFEHVYVTIEMVYLQVNIGA